jgi:uncharacterized protein YaeQ
MLRELMQVFENQLENLQATLAHAKKKVRDLGIYMYAWYQITYATKPVEKSERYECRIAGVLLLDSQTSSERSIQRAHL